MIILLHPFVFKADDVRPLTLKIKVKQNQGVLCKQSWLRTFANYALNLLLPVSVNQMWTVVADFCCSHKLQFTVTL